MTDAQERGHASATTKVAVWLALALVGAACETPREAKVHERDPDRFATPTPTYVDCPVATPTPDEEADPVELPALECGYIEVPIDYADPAGKTTRVAFRVRPASSPSGRRGVLFVNPGGPGLAALDSLYGVDSSWPQDVLDVYDIVAFDPRGIGESGGVRCAPEVDELREIDPLPTSAEDYAAAQAALQTALEAQLVSQSCVDPELARAMGTANVARDMDVLRRSLGEGRLSFVGRSYGGWLGAVYATNFPNHVDRFVLDAPPPPTADVREWVLALARLQQTALEDTVGSCPAGCELGEDDFVAQLRSRIAQLHEVPRPLKPQQPGDPTGMLRGVDVVRALAQLPYLDLERRRVLLRNVARLYDDDPERRRVAELEVAAAAFASPIGLVRTDALAVLCADQAPLLDPDQVFAVVETLRDEDNLFASFALFFLGGCPAFEMVRPDPPRLSNDGHDATSDRVLVVGATDDRVVPFDAAIETAATVQAALVTADHDRHGTLYEGHNGCAEDAATRHLLGDAVSATTCVYEANYDEPCAILQARACRPGFKCGVFGATTVPRCMAFEPGPLDDACATTEFCDDGLHCTNIGASKSTSTCQPLCTSDHQCTAADAVCSVVLPELAGVCASACDPFDDACGPDLQCKRLRTTIDGQGVAHCVATGWLAPGAGCNTADACAAGTTCRSDRCVQLCDNGHPCALGTCQAVGTGSLGYCE